MSEELARVLARAEELVRKGWCRGEDALDSAGLPVSPASPQAARFDARGAIRRACAELGLPSEAVLDEAADALDDAVRHPEVPKMGKFSIVGWNDAKGQTQAEVADALRRARELI